MMRKVIMVASALALSNAVATEYFVDWRRPNDSGSGKTEADAFQTIQAAVDKCAASGDIVTVLPGVYTNGTISSCNGQGRARVFITERSLTLRAKPGSKVEDVVIEGRFDPDSDWHGMGPNAARALTILGGYNVIVRGFTIRNSASAGTAAAHGDGTTVRGGAVYGPDESAFTLVDCVLTGNAGTRGGAVYGGRCVRCRIIGNIASNAGSAVREGALFHCLVANNRAVEYDDAGVIAYPHAVVNCTIANNGSKAIVSMVAGFGAGPIYNTVICNNDACWDNSKQYDKFAGCVADCGANATFVGYGNQVGTTHEVASPLTDDWRLHQYSVGIGKGNKDWLATIPEAFRNESVDGVDVSAAETLHPGCFQKTVTLKTAFFRVPATSASATSVLDGRSVARASHVAFESWPKTLAYAYAPVDSTMGLVRYKVTRDNVHHHVFCPALDDTLNVLMPRADGAEYAILPETAAIVHVDVANAADGAQDGTVSHPYATIQRGVDANKALSYVRVAKGVYKTDETTANGVKTRVVLSGRTGVVRVVAPEGATILGSADTDYADGRGPNAVRCVSVVGSVGGFIQGFTLKDGHSSRTATDGDCADVRAGGAYGYESDMSALTLADCTFDGCVATRGAAAFFVACERCRFTKCEATNNGVVRNSTLTGCLVDQNVGNGILGGGVTAYQTTAVRNEPPSGKATLSYNMNNSYGLVSALTVSPGGDVGELSSTVHRESLIEFSNGWKEDPSSVVDKAPLFADANANDFRFNSWSPAVALLSAENVPWTRFQVRDLTGKAFAISAVGKLVAGAYADVVPGVKVENGEKGGVTPLGTVTALDGTVTLTATADRAIAGWEVNGETIATTARIYALDCPPFDADGNPYRATARPVYSTFWYVDAENGADNETVGTGYSPETAFRTLAAVMAKAESGDTVYAAPGDYREKTMKSAAGPSGLSGNSLPSRVTVGYGVTLESAEGPEVTFITGEADSADATYGLGSAAIRGVSLNGQGTVRGFTIRNGHTFSGAESADTSGGGVLASGTGALVEDCIIRDCCSTRGGAARSGSFNRCRFLDNKCSANGAAARDARVRNSFADGNITPGENLCVFYDGYLENCTIGPNNKRSNGGSTWGFFSGVKGGAVAVNTLFGNNGAIYSVICSNCVIGTTAQVPSNVTAVDMKYGDVSLDEDGRPLWGNVAIDGADPTLDRYPEENADLYGVQRVYNGCRDIGCCEYDWRGRYAADLHRNGKIVVSSASPDAREVANGVLLCGGTLTADWSIGGRGGYGSVDCEVTGSGTLCVSTNGVPFATLTKADGPRRLSFENDMPKIELAFSYASETDDAGGALLSRCARFGLGTAIILR